MTKENTVGILLMCRDAHGNLMGILQVRPKWDRNTEKDCKGSWPGGCQVTTANGKLEGEEDFKQALLRKVKEELGGRTAQIVSELINDCKLVILTHSNAPEKRTIIYGGVLDKPDHVVTVLSENEGYVRLIRREKVEKIRNLTQFDKALGPQDPNIIAMFPDEKEAVRLAFEEFG